MDEWATEWRSLVLLPQRTQNLTHHLKASMNAAPRALAPPGKHLLAQMHKPRGRVCPLDKPSLQWAGNISRFLLLFRAVQSLKISSHWDSTVCWARCGGSHMLHLFTCLSEGWHGHYCHFTLGDVQGSLSSNHLLDPHFSFHPLLVPSFLSFSLPPFLPPFLPFPPNIYRVCV